jgi:hypothetical protein
VTEVQPQIRWKQGNGVGIDGHGNHLRTYDQSHRAASFCRIFAYAAYNHTVEIFFKVQDIAVKPHLHIQFERARVKMSDFSVRHRWR